MKENKRIKRLLQNSTKINYKEIASQIKDETIGWHQVVLMICADYDLSYGQAQKIYDDVEQSLPIETYEDFIAYD